MEALFVVALLSAGVTVVSAACDAVVTRAHKGQPLIKSAAAVADPQSDRAAGAVQGVQRAA